MNDQTAIQKEIEAIDGEIARPRSRIALRPDFEAGFQRRIEGRRIARFVRWHMVALFLNLACLPLDHLAGILGTGLIVRLGLVTPLYAAAVLILLRGPRKLQPAAIVLPLVAFACAAMFLGFQVPSPDSDRYLMAAAILLIGANIITPMSFWQALTASLLSIAGLFAMQITIGTVEPDAIGLSAFIAGVALISAVVRFHSEREARNAFLLNRKDEIRSAHLLALTNALAELAQTDALTGLPNRRSLSQELAEKWRHASERNDWIGILMIDIDHFKKFNDVAGHDKGDSCLREVAAALRTEAGRDGHYVARFGGEEFTAILTGMEPEPAIEAAEALRRSVERLGLPHPAFDEGSHVTVSIGGSVLLPAPQVSVEDALAAADKALYEAKSAGRNRVAFGRVPERPAQDRKPRQARAAFR